MENILKKWNSKWFLLFLFTFFSITTQAQWDEDTDGDGVLDWVESIWDATPDGENSTWTFEDGSIVEAHNTTIEELQADYERYDSIYGEGSTASQIGTVFNANGTIAASFGFGTAAMIGGTYIGGFNANGVLRVYVGNADLPMGPSPAPGWIGTVTILPIYNYYFPDGTVTTSNNPSDSNIVVTNITTITSVGVTSTQTIIQTVTPTPCKGDPIKNPQIAPQRNSGMNGGRFGNTRSGGTQYHNGLDIKNPYGAPVYAMFDGNVSLAGNAKDKAGFIGYQTATVNGSAISVQYFHMQDAGRVTGFVHAGDIIGYQGDSGNLARAISSGATESHVHIKIKDSNGKTLNPENYLTTKFDSNGQPINNCN